MLMEGLNLQFMIRAPYRLAIQDSVSLKMLVYLRDTHSNLVTFLGLYKQNGVLPGLEASEKFDDRRMFVYVCFGYEQI